MNRGIYSLASGMVAAQQAMDVVSNNLANVNTSGYKRDQALFNDALERAITSPNGNSLGTLGSGATIKQEYTDFSQGAIRSTGNLMDVAIQGSGMFAVQGPNGETLYTRDGSFTKGPNGQLVNQQGYPVLDSSSRAITLQPGQMTLSADGQISSGDNPPYSRLGLFTGTFAKAGNGLFASQDAAPATGLKVAQGSVEGSNVNPVTSMVDMIGLSRNFDMAQKSIQSEDDMTQKLTSTLTQ